MHEHFQQGLRAAISRDLARSGEFWDHERMKSSLAEVLPIFRDVLKAAESDASSALRLDP